MATPRKRGAASVGRRLRLRAMAKINLSLRVLGTRPDGFHDVRTTLQSIALHDVLTLTPASGPMTITCDTPECPPDESNLVWRAAERLWRADGRRGRMTGVHIDLRKGIPMQAGLGGGSSDAAAALRGLPAVWGTRVDAARVLEIARGIGADVAFFLEGGTSLGVDRGDILYPLVDQPKAWVVLVKPGFGVSTTDAYRWWDADRVSNRVADRANTDRRTPPLAIPERANDLQSPVSDRHPEIAGMVRHLARGGSTHAAMSGSGSAVFGLFDRQGDAIEAAARVMGWGRLVLVTPTVDRQEYHRLSRPRRD